jgi:hypothetical protein
MEHTLSYGGRGENVPYRGEWSRREESKLNVPNENGEPTAVIVPIELWREIESERETPYLLRSETMKARLWRPNKIRTGFLSRPLLRSPEFDPEAFEDRAWWVEQDRAQALRLIRPIRETQLDPLKGIGSLSR